MSDDPGPPVEGTADEISTPERAEPTPGVHEPPAESNVGMALAHRPVSQEVMAPLDVTAVKESMTAYQDGLRALLDKSDWQDAGRDGSFVKKSGWRKIATWFNLSVEPLKEHVERDENGSPLRARVWVLAIAPNGRTMAGDGACSVDESRFSKPKGRGKLENDLLGTATTRAKNRAISDLVGMGAVSAEEMDGDAGHAGAGGMAAAGQEDVQACSTALMTLLSQDEQAARDAFGKLKALTAGQLAAPVAQAVAIVAAAVRAKYSDGDTPPEPTTTPGGDTA